jgi:hypothetical protein
MYLGGMLRKMSDFTETTSFRKSFSSMLYSQIIIVFLATRKKVVFNLDAHVSLVLL